MVSVIVPVYNVEKFLTRCVQSICGQTYTDFELLLVDDGSTDRSGECCELLAQSDQRIHVFHKENGGLSDARNYGLDRAAGEFVTFIDSDDYIGPDYLRILLEMQQQYQADISMISSIRTHSETVDWVESQDERSCLQPAEALKEIILGRKYGVSAWGKLYKHTLFEKNRFPLGLLYEDLYTTPYLIKDCQCFAYSTSKQYYYYQRDNSIMHTISDKAAEMWNEGMEKLYSYVEKTHPELLDCVNCGYVNSGFAIVINNLIPSSDYTPRAKAFKRRHLDWWKNALHNPYLSTKTKLRTFLFVSNVDLYRVIYKIHMQAKGKS